MKPTVTYIEKKFEEFNRQIFGGRLPKLPIELSDASGFLGKCVFHQRRLPNGLKEYGDFRLRINTRIDLPENVIEDTIIHEMIHYLILWTGLQDTSDHGDIFRAIMTSINTAHGRNISVRHHNSAEEAEQAVSTKRTWHVIAAIYFKTGKTGVKVLPRTVPKILDYYRVAVAHREVQEVRLYLHDNPFFNRYPTSAALRIHDIDKDLLESNLAKARPLKINGSQIVEER
ncbi:MAG: SprT-like domain-containing protein [Bacteroides sp.]|nr:SprT-like domain-containing protein [Bacteroides sp.]MCM1379834.1 SprT-like domain-containing protein [Bacteroides sp.]MCM1446193.1 SprT-like domain-containing protein [Prevotella sp.]